MKNANGIPNKAKKLGHNHLAEGEHTGHFHAAEGATLYADGEELFAAVPEGGSVVTHQEHHDGFLPEGNYDIYGVLEQDHAAEEARRVID